MEQASLFDEPAKTPLEISFFNSIRDRAKDKFEAECAPLSWLYLRRNKDNYAIVVKKTVAARIRDGKKPWVELQSNNLQKQYIESFCNEDIIESILANIYSALDSMESDFACCSRYEECSDAGRCTHPDKEFAFGCYYRKNLGKGNIFYGRNANLLHTTGKVK